MQEKKVKPLKKFKPTPRRFHPKGLTIVYEDWDIIVVDKSAGLLSVANEKVRENTAYYLLNNYVRKGNKKSRKRVFVVHRLDRETSGLLVFAKSETAKKFLQENWEKFSKNYYAVVRGKMQSDEGVFTSYLTENSVHNMYSTDDKDKGKFAKTGYKVLRGTRKMTLLNIELFTGRKNQIRVHLAENGTPVAGDKKYGGKKEGVKRLALHSYKLDIMHPFSKEKMHFETKLPNYFKLLVKE